MAEQKTSEAALSVKADRRWIAPPSARTISSTVGLESVAQSAQHFLAFVLPLNTRPPSMPRGFPAAVARVPLRDVKLLACLPRRNRLLGRWCLNAWRAYTTGRESCLHCRLHLFYRVRLGFLFGAGAAPPGRRAWRAAPLFVWTIRPTFPDRVVYSIHGNEKPGNSARQRPRERINSK